MDSAVGHIPMLAEHLNDKGWNAIINNNLNGTFFATREIANAVCFLASPMTSYINGISLYVDGAAHLNFDKMVLVDMARGGKRE